MLSPCIALTLFTVFTTWGKNRKILYQLTIGCAVAFTINIVCIVLYLQSMNGQYEFFVEKYLQLNFLRVIGSVLWVASLNTCLMTKVTGHEFIVTMRIVQVTTLSSASGPLFLLTTM